MDDDQKNRLRFAVLSLDPANEDHWTAGGTPAVGAVEALLGESTSRKEINQVAHDINRETILGLVDAVSGPERHEAETDAVDMTPFEAARRKMEAAEAAMNAAQREFLAAQAEVDRQIEAGATRRDHRTSQEEIRRYLAKSHAIAAEKASALQQLKDAGVDLKALSDVLKGAPK
jgi:hypothetical protein